LRTLAGHPKTQKVILMQDLRLLEFDKNRHINQQKILVFDNNNVKYDIIMSTNLLSKTGFKSNYSEGNWNGLISPSHFIHLEVWNLNKFDAMEDMFHIQVKDKLFGED
jgi:hypothetical protein